LSEAYLRYREEAAGQSSASAIAATGLIRVGDADSRVRAIAAQLVDSGYLPAAGAGDVYTEAIAEAVKLLQHDYGIAADGVIGPDTLKVVNLGPAERARALAVALERRRWLSRTPPATRIDVNTAAAHLRYFRDGQLVDSRKVIVGKPGWETPALLAPIYRLVANPSWTVPRSIQNTELANVGDDYLGSRNMTIRDGWIVQQPGPGNALGLVKFDMQNDQAIYLHDTSSPELFDRSERHLSHGCVRVEDALGFAQLLAEDEGVGAAWGKASLSSDTAFVPLPRKIPVRMLYHNVFVADNGQLAFRTDPYGWNDAVAQALGFGAAAVPRPRPGAIDVGP
jgi:L,D-transpeptidase YcbB